MKRFDAALLTILALGASAAPERPVAEMRAEFLRWGYGMFIHFGMATFTEREWANGDEDPAAFAPGRLDCGQWADVARNAGMRYAVLTTKHTDGWALWDSRPTGHDITAFKNFDGGRRDLVREFVDAFRARGIKIGLYYCFPGDYANRNGNTLPPDKPNLHGLPSEAKGDYTGFIKKQLEELLTGYGPIDLLWIDQYRNKFTNADWPGIKAFIHSLQPNCLVMANNSKNDQDTDLHGYEYPWLKKARPGTELPPPDNPHPAEVCDTLTGTDWFWKTSHDESSIKTAKEIADMVALCNARRANYLLNVPPDISGRIPKIFVDRLRAAARLIGAAGVAPDGPRDLLAGPLEPAEADGWMHYSETPGTSVSDVWTLTDSVLVCKGSPKGYLFRTEELVDFTLSLEWRRPAGVKPGKAGVLIRTTGPDKIWPRSLEAQLNGGQAGDFWGLDGFALDGPEDRKSTVDHEQFGRLTNLKRTADAEKPVGEWNLYEIEARGPVVTLRINGVEVNRATGCDTVAGRICLTAEGDEIHFRNIRLLRTVGEPTNAAEAAAPVATGAGGVDAEYAALVAALPPEAQAWERTLQENLGNFYLPLYKAGRVKGTGQAWDYVKDDPGLPRVLLIGDSISRGYTLPVRRALAGRANVHRAPENCGPTANGIRKLDLWLGDGRWDVIHFNFGIHDRATPPDEYRRRLESLVERLKATGATLLWAGTTPIPPDTKDGPEASEAIVARNRIAAEVMARHGIAVNDLFTLIAPRLAELQKPGDVHFTEAGYDALGSQVASAIVAALGGRRPSGPRASPDFTGMIPEVFPRSAVYRQEGYCLWDPCIVRSDDGAYHLLYSRWPASLGFDAWCTHAEIAWATSVRASGPYKFRDVVLPARGVDFWDGHSTYNTCVIRHGGKFYLYYTGNRGTEAWTPDGPIRASSDAWWVQRNNQRIGVAVADHPGGPWRRMDTPLIDVGPGFGQGIVAVPNVVAKPGGGLRLYYKTLAEGPGRFGGGVFHYGADSDDPLGPFVRHPEPMVDKNRLLNDAGKRFNFHIDDHFEWIQDGRWYAIVKDHDAPFLTPHGRSLLLFESSDGRRWHPSRHALVKDFSIAWDDGTAQDFNRLEMPKLLMDGGRPTVLSLAARAQGAPDSFLILVPLAGGKETGP